MKKLAMILLTALAALSSASSARADVTCTVTGRMTYEPVDRYYCDETYFGVGNCGGWNQKNLDTATGVNAKPLNFMKLTFWKGATLLTTAHTNNDGKYTAKFVLAGVNTCTGQVVTVKREFTRVREDQVSGVATPNYRFRIVDDTNLNYRESGGTSITLSGATTTKNTLRTRGGALLIDRLFALYYTLNATVTEMVSWNPGLISPAWSSTVLNSQQRIVFDDSNLDNSYNSGSIVAIGYNDYAGGGTIRHEMGHRLHNILHKNQSMACLSYTFGGDAGGTHNYNSCEFGFPTTLEAIANFFAVRSATSSDNGAWICLQQAGAADICSNEVFNNVGDGVDKDDATGSWIFLGDLRANKVTHCAVPEANCSCVGCSVQQNKNTNGWRMESQVARFMWDMLDANNEDGKDDTNITIGNLVAQIAAMSCTAGDLGEDSCNEPNTSPCSSDEYNVYDLGEMIAGDQAAERLLNCVNTPGE